LEGAKFKFEVWMDHKNMEYFMKIQKLNQKQAHCVLYLSRFDFTLKHVLGTKMGKANRLSRKSDWKVGKENNNDNQTLILKNKDKEVVRVVKKMKKAEVKKLRGKE